MADIIQFMKNALEIIVVGHRGSIFKGSHQFSTNYYSKDIIEPLATDFAGAFSQYNRTNLAKHLDYIINSQFRGKGRLEESDVDYLLGEVQRTVVVADQKKAQQVYDRLKEGFSRLIT